MKEVDSEELQSSEDENEKKKKLDARKAGIKKEKIKDYLEKKNSRGNLAKSAEIINIFAIGDDNKITEQDL